MKEPTARYGKRPARRPKALTPAYFESLALRYLDRFDATVVKLKKHLERAAARQIARGAEPPDTGLMERWIAGLLERYQASGVVDDRRYAEGLLRRLRERGQSSQRIVHKLRAHGVAAALISELMQLGTLDRGDDLAAARLLVKRRKLGPFRSTPADPRQRRADLARLARAGFDFRVAAEALGGASELESFDE